MRQRFHEVFNPPKIRAAIVAVCAGFLAIPFFMMGGFGGIEFGLSSLIVAFFYGCIWLYKFNRDVSLRQPKIEQPKPEVIEITSPGSSRLFVPDPLDRS